RGRPALVGTLRFAGYRFHHLRALRPAQPGTRLGRERRYFSLPASHGATRRAYVVPHWRPRPRRASAALPPAGRGQNAFRSYVNDLRKAGREGAHTPDERFAGRDARRYTFRRIEFRGIFRAAMVSGSRKLSALRRLL